MKNQPNQLRVAIVVTHIAPAAGYGGIAEATARVAEAWAVAGHSFSLCASDASEGTPPLRPADVGLPAAIPVHLYHAQLWRRWGLGAGAIPAILRACRRAESVYVSGVGTWPTSLAGLICRLLRRPFVVAVHGGLMPGHVDHIRRSKPMKWLFYRWITLPTLAAAQAVHATSTAEADGVHALLPSVSVAVLPNAIDLADWPVLPPRSPDGGLVIGYIGRLSPEKGILPFLKAWLDTRRPGDRLLIAGSGSGAYAAEVVRLAATAGEAVELRGYLKPDGVRRLLADSDAVVLPSGLGDGGLRENFGNVVVEAMACGRAVLATRGMAWDDLEQDGAGLVFAPDGTAAREVLRRTQGLAPDHLAAMGLAGRRLVEGRFVMAPVADRLWRLVAGRV